MGIGYVTGYPDISSPYFLLFPSIIINEWGLIVTTPNTISTPKSVAINYCNILYLALL